MPPRAALKCLPCVPARYTTKNEHLHPGICRRGHGIFTVDVSVFRAHLPRSPYRCHQGRGIVRLAEGRGGGVTYKQVAHCQTAKVPVW